MPGPEQILSKYQMEKWMDGCWMAVERKEEVERKDRQMNS